MMKRLTWPKRLIIKRKSQFQCTYEKGKVFVGRYITLRLLDAKELSAILPGAKDDPLSPSRFAVAAGKKLGSAVVRNRVKRLLRESLRLEQENIRSGLALLVIGRPAAIKAKQPKIGHELSFLLKKAHALKPVATP